ncbi:type II secretion system protein J [Planctomycetota bacterium]
MKNQTRQFAGLRAKRTRCTYAMSLPELLVAIVVGALVMTTAFTFYNRIQQATGAVMQHLEGLNLPAEVIQLIAEDLDKLVAIETATRVMLESKPDGGLTVVRLTIEHSIKDEENKDLLLDKIVWQSGVDASTNRLTLYRAHMGKLYEDPLLDRKRPDRDSFYPFIPVCTGLTVFRLEVPQVGEAYVDRWQSSALPPGIRVSLSFAEPRDSVQGIIDVEEEDLIQRTIAVDRIRKFQLDLVADVNDANTLNSGELASEPPEDQQGRTSQRGR